MILQEVPTDSIPESKGKTDSDPDSAAAENMIEDKHGPKCSFLLLEKQAKTCANTAVYFLKSSNEQG